MKINAKYPCAVCSNTYSRKRFLLCVASCFVTCLLSSATHADVTIVSKVTVDQTITPPPAPPSVTVSPAGAKNDAAPDRKTGEQHDRDSNPPTLLTSYFRGGNVRTEISNGLISLYDGSTGQVYTLDPSVKTYYVQPLSVVQIAPQTTPGGRIIAMKVENDLTLTAGDLQRSIDGIEAKVVQVGGTVTLHPAETGASGPGGGRHHHGGGGFGTVFGGGSGGFGGSIGGTYGGSGGGYIANENVRAKTVEVSGELWMSDALKLPNDKKSDIFPAVYMAGTGESFVFKPLADSLDKNRQIPLASRITVTRSLPDGSQESITTTSEVTSISRADVPNDLFRLPIGYTEVAPPSASDVSGGGQ